MKATKTWHCSCCNETIHPGDTFYIRSGSLLCVNCDMNKLFDTAEEQINKRINRLKAEQLELVPVTHDYSKVKRELPEQQDLQDLPMFNLEYQKTEQLSLF